MLRCYLLYYSRYCLCYTLVLLGHGGLGSCEKESLLHLLHISLPGCCTRGAGQLVNQAIGRAHASRVRIVNQVVGAPFECGGQQGGGVEVVSFTSHSQVSGQIVLGGWRARL